MFREDFPLLNNDVIYFDNGATTLKPKCVIDAINDYYTNYSVNIHRGEYDLSFKADTAYEDARNNVAKFINAPKNTVIFTKGCTDSLNMVASGYFKNILNKDDEILITKSEHASNVLPWFNLAKTNGVKVNFIELDENLHVTLENVKKAVNEHTRVIALAGITNVIGDIRPIKEICAYAHEHNILVVEDGAQSVPHSKVDVIDRDVDFLAFSGHKILGPTGIGVLYIKESLLDDFDVVEFGGGMNESFDSVEEVYLKSSPARYEAGTPHIAGAIGLSAAIDYISNIGMNCISNYEVGLKEYLVEKLNKINHIKVINPESKSGIVSITIDDVFPQDAGYYLNKYNICVRTGNHCAKILKDEIGIRNTLRISLYFYNTKEEIDKLVELLSDKDKIISEMI